MSFPKISSFKYWPGMAIVDELGVIVFFSGFLVDSYFDYRGGKPLSQISGLAWMVAIMMAVLVLGVHYLLFCTADFNLQHGIAVYSRFRHKYWAWDDVDSIEFVISKKNGSAGLSHGAILIFSLPYMAKSRMVRIAVHSKGGRDAVFWPRMNLGKVNRLFAMLRDSGRFEVERHQINFSEYMGKKYKNPMRDLWVFRTHDGDMPYTCPYLFIRHEDGSLWKASYSTPAKWLIRIGVVSTAALILAYYAFAAHYTLTANHTLIATLLILLFSSLAVGFLLAFFTPELKAKPNFQAIATTD